MKKRSHHAWGPRRAGAATLEFSIVAPVFFLCTLGLVQFAGLSWSQNMLTAAARHGGRVGAMEATESHEDVVAVIEERLSRSGVNPEVIDIDVAPEDLGSLESGDEFTITLTGAMSDLTWTAMIPMPSSDLHAEITYRRE